MKKVLFTIRIHSIVYEITNSSSELFVGIHTNKEEFIALLEATYPDYLDEYEEVRTIDELGPDELDNYFSYACSAHCWPSTKDMYPVLPGFTFDELYESDDDENKNWGSRGEHFKLRNNEDNNDPYGYFVTEDNFELIKNKLDPNRIMFFLYSISDNPNWEMQEELEKFMIRYHLG